MTRRLFSLAALPVFARLFGWILNHASFLLPVKKLADTPALIAFAHPWPSYPLHILILPKREIPRLACLSPADGPFLAEVLMTACALAPGCRLVANAGAYQGFPRLHFHLISAENPGP